MPTKKAQKFNTLGLFSEAGDEARTHEIYLGKVTC
jgi:hypothetical protein